jgi:hypothetical protein
VYSHSSDAVLAAAAPAHVHALESSRMSMHMQVGRVLPAEAKIANFTSVKMNKIS